LRLVLICHFYYFPQISQISAESNPQIIKEICENLRDLRENFFQGLKVCSYKLFIVYSILKSEGHGGPDPPPRCRREGNDRFPGQARICPDLSRLKNERRDRAAGIMDLVFEKKEY